MENNAKPRVLTIGHSNHTVEHFLGLLRAHGIQVVVDERSQPYSKYATQFDQDLLKPALQNAGFRYLYLGRELGGRPEGDEFYDAEGHVLYDRVAATSLFQEGLKRLERGIREYNVAMLCAEENPAGCHRRLLVRPRAARTRISSGAHSRRRPHSKRRGSRCRAGTQPRSIIPLSENRGGTVEVYSIGFTKKTTEQ